MVHPPQDEATTSGEVEQLPGEAHSTSTRGTDSGFAAVTVADRESVAEDDTIKHLSADAQRLRRPQPDYPPHPMSSLVERSP